jgi:transcriptional regulator with GAF, ATPase, and Fis domain
MGAEHASRALARLFMSQTALIIVVAGAGRGRSLPLADTVSIGRGDDNVLTIPDPALSRHHCVVEMTPTGPVVRDLQSKNGVFVNGCPVTERPLSDSDQIRIGDSALLVVLSQSAAAVGGESAVAVVNTPVQSTSTIAIETASIPYWNREQTGGDGGVIRTAARLRALLMLSDALQQAGTVATLFEALLAGAAEAFDAELTAVVARADGDDALGVVSARTRNGRTEAVNSGLATKALTERSAILSHDDPAMCAPLMGGEPLTEAVFVARAPGRQPFSVDDLQVLAAMATVGGMALDRVRHLEWLTAENRRLQSDLDADHNLIGESAAMATVHRFISRVATTDSTVLLRGESGTGKELVASAIHRKSARGQGPFVAINCAALPEALLESELFGHERGAFSGAFVQKRGRLEMADGGTLFLDEVGELAIQLQAKLLRVLQDQVVERIGARRGIKINVRIIAATNRDLETAIEQGAFRDDLYFRLNVVALTMPPLRERRDDLPLLASYFVRQHADRCKRDVKGISVEARKLLMAYDWPGNVRELSNAIERAVVLGSQDVILPEDLPEAIAEAGGADADPGFHSQVAERKREIISAALDRSGGNVARAARDLSLQPTYLHRLIRNLGVRIDHRS